MDDQELEAIRAKRMAEMQARAVSIKISNQYLGYILVIMQKINNIKIPNEIPICYTLGSTVGNL